MRILSTATRIQPVQQLRPSTAKNQSFFFFFKQGLFWQLSQWLRLHASTAGGAGLGNRDPTFFAVQWKKKKEKKKKKKETKWSYLQNSNSHIDTENKLKVIKEGVNWEFGISRIKLPYIKQINNKVLLYSTGNYIQYIVIMCNLKIWKSIYKYIYI